MSPCLFFVVPTLNSHLLLSRLLLSLQQQTWRRWKILFVDGASDSEHRSWLRHCCSVESRCSWVEQDPDQPGIFGAMNKGFELAEPQDWLLFWGSDDWAASPEVLETAVCSIQSCNYWPDLLVCSGRYFDNSTDSFGRRTSFHSGGLMTSLDFRRALLLGSTPPHQSTLFGPGSRSKLASYSSGFRLTADLDYFLRISRKDDLRVVCLDLELVYMANGGVSSQQTKRRLREVCRAYQLAFGWRWWFPFFARYSRRLFSLFQAAI
jgi:glycosyltransferase involved in cell wall biosynthesis